MLDMDIDVTLDHNEMLDKFGQVCYRDIDVIFDNNEIFGKNFEHVC